MATKSYKDTTKLPKQMDESSDTRSRPAETRENGRQQSKKTKGSSRREPLHNSEPSQDNLSTCTNDPFLGGGEFEGFEGRQGWSTGDDGQQFHALEKVELFRSIQASTQKLFDVFDNNIGMLEELEKHETHGKQIQNSGILSHVIPVDQKKPIYDAIAGIELQLKCLQAQMRSLNPDITKKAKEVLVEQTLKWAATREAARIPYGDVDHYCTNVLQILLYSAPKELPNVDRGPMNKPTTEEVNEVISQVARQRYLGEKQDKEFHNDPKKKAKLSKKRQAEDISEGTHGLLLSGAHRLSRHDSKLAVVLDEEGYAPDASMDTT